MFLAGCFRARSYEETTRRILLYGFIECCRKWHRSTATWRRHKCINEISSAWNEDEPFDENIPLLAMDIVESKAKMKLVTLNLKLARLRIQTTIGQRRRKLEGNFNFIPFPLKTFMATRLFRMKLSANGSLNICCLLLQSRWTGNRQAILNFLFLNTALWIFNFLSIKMTFLSQLFSYF